MQHKITWASFESLWVWPHSQNICNSATKTSRSFCIKYAVLKESLISLPLVQAHQHPLVPVIQALLGNLGHPGKQHKKSAHLCNVRFTGGLSCCRGGREKKMHSWMHLNEDLIWYEPLVQCYQVQEVLLGQSFQQALGPPNGHQNIKYSHICER